jgi:Carboxypeptidase regulatory-like domain
MSTTFQGAPAWPADSGESNGAGGQPVYGHVRQAGGVPVSGATVTLIEASGRQAGRSRTGADGSYQVRVAQPGVYTLVAIAAGHQPQAAVVHAGGGPVEHDVLLAGVARLAGTVRAAGTGRPIPDATVALADSRGEVMAACNTDDAGRYLFGELPAGSYTVAVSAPSYQPSALPVTVLDGTQVTVDAELHGRARVEGTARGTRETVVPDARVILLDPDGNVAAVTTTGPDGRYAFENLAESDYTVIASGYPPATSTLRVTSGQPHSHDVNLGYPEA